jgi:hypothetical protein
VGPSIPGSAPPGGQQMLSARQDVYDMLGLETAPLAGGPMRRSRSGSPALARSISSRGQHFHGKVPRSSTRPGSVARLLRRRAGSCVIWFHRFSAKQKERLSHRFGHADLLGPRKAGAGSLPLGLSLEQALYVKHPGTWP